MASAISLWLYRSKFPSYGPAQSCVHKHFGCFLYAKAIIYIDHFLIKKETQSEQQKNNLQQIMTCTVIATVCMYALCGLHMRKVFHTNKIIIILQYVVSCII